MSREDVETVKALFAAFAQRNLEAAEGLLDPGVEIRPSIVGGPEGRVYRGLSGNRRFWADIDEAWEEFRIEVDELRDLAGRVLVLGTALARGRESRVPLRQPGAWLVGLRDGRITRFQSFSDQRSGIEAAEARG